MEVEFDPDKDARNRARHGLPLDFGAEVVKAAVTTVLDARFDYGEERFVSFGYVGGRLYVCVFAVREDRLRIISVRKANDREVERYG